MKKIVFIILITLLPISRLLAQQDYSNKFDLKIGAGAGFMGFGDVVVFCLENEFNYKIKNYFTVAASLGIGRGNGNWAKSHNDYISGSANVFVSPFRNNRRNNFRVGGGYTFINVAASSIGSIQYLPFYEIRYVKESYSAHCFNVIIEDEFKITTRLMIGAKLFYTGNFKDGSGEIFGGLIKFGIVL